jgi:Tfp pilus assembly protein PilN
VRAVNLIPSEQRSGGNVGSRSEGGAFIVLGLLAGLTVLALLYGLARHEVSSQRAEAASLSARAQQVQAQAAALAPYTSFMAMREERLQAVSQLIGDRFDWADALHELGRVLPYETSLSSVQGSVGSSVGAVSSAATAPTTGAASAAVTSATPPGETPTFTLTGCATSQSMVAQTLVRLHLIDGVGKVTLQSSTKAGGGSASGSCPGSDPEFTVQVTFDPLPTPPTAKAEASPTASSDASTRSDTSSVTPSSGAAKSTNSTDRAR